MSGNLHSLFAHLRAPPQVRDVARPSQGPTRMLFVNDQALEVSDALPLRAVVDLVCAHEHVVVVSAAGSLQGLVRTDALRKLAARVPDVPLRMVPLTKVLPAVTERAHSLLALGEVDALLVERTGREWTLIMRAA